MTIDANHILKQLNDVEKTQINLVDEALTSYVKSVGPERSYSYRYDGPFQPSPEVIKSVLQMWEDNGWIVETDSEGWIYLKVG